MKRETRSSHAVRLHQSPRGRRWLSLVLSACSLGAVAVFITLIWDQAGETDAPPSEEAAKVISQGHEVPLSAEVIDVATRWILGAVTRGDLAATYVLTDPDIRGSMTRAEWELGAIPVVSYPVGELSRKSWRVRFSRVREALLEVRLVPRARLEAVAPRTFLIGLKRVGVGQRVNWVVNYWSPTATWSGVPASG